MSRFSTIVYSIIVPSIVALVFFKVSERHKIDLLNFNSVTGTLKSIFTGMKNYIGKYTGANLVIEGTTKLSEKEELPSKEKGSSQENIKQKEPLKPVTPQKAPSTKHESNVKEETKSVKKDDVKKTSGEIKPKQMNTTHNQSKENKKAAGEKVPSVSKTLNKTPPVQQVNKITEKQVEEKQKQTQKLDYTNPETKTIAEGLKTFITEFDKRLENLSVELKTNNELLVALKVVKELKESLPKGSKCSLSKEEEALLEKVKLECETIVNQCAKSQTSVDNELKLVIRESTKKIQNIDANLRQNLEQCPQPPSNFCIQTKTKLLKSLNDLSSEQNKNKLSGLSNENLSKAKLNIDSCFKERSVKIKIPLEKIHYKINNCISL